jgi:hypothetical protein
VPNPKVPIRNSFIAVGRGTGTEDGGEGGLCPGVNFKVLPETTLLRDYQEVKLQESASGATGVPRCGVCPSCRCATMHDSCTMPERHAAGRI